MLSESHLFFLCFESFSWALYKVGAVSIIISALTLFHYCYHGVLTSKTFRNVFLTYVAFDIFLVIFRFSPWFNASIKEYSSMQIYGVRDELPYRQYGPNVITTTQIDEKTVFSYHYYLMYIVVVWIISFLSAIAPYSALIGIFFDTHRTHQFKCVLFLNRVIVTLSIVIIIQFGWIRGTFPKIFYITDFLVGILFAVKGIVPLFENASNNPIIKQINLARHTIGNYITINHVLGFALLIRSILTLLWSLYIYNTFEKILNASTIEVTNFVAQNGTTCYTSILNKSFLWCTSCPSATYTSFIFFFLGFFQFCFALDLFAFDEYYSKILSFKLPKKKLENIRKRKSIRIGNI